MKDNSWDTVGRTYEKGESDTYGCKILKSFGRSTVHLGLGRVKVITS